MLVGLPSASPSHQSTSSAVASSTLRRRTSMPGIRPAPSATSPAIFAVLPLAESYRTRTLPIKLLSCSPAPGSETLQSLHLLLPARDQEPPVDRVRGHCLFP